MASFTSVLKKIGQVLLKGSEVAAEVMQFPFVAQLLSNANAKLSGAIQTGISDWNAVAGIASMAETMFPLPGSGSQKLAAAAPLVQQSILLWAQSNLPGHNKLKDPAKLATASAGILSNFADAMNAFGE